MLKKQPERNALQPQNKKTASINADGINLSIQRMSSNSLLLELNLILVQQVFQEINSLSSPSRNSQMLLTKWIAGLIKLMELERKTKRLLKVSMNDSGHIFIMLDLMVVSQSLKTMRQRLK
jgi:uncharacterized protein (DUF1015 family)